MKQRTHKEWEEIIQRNNSTIRVLRNSLYDRRQEVDTYKQDYERIRSELESIKDILKNLNKFLEVKTK